MNIFGGVRTPTEIDAPDCESQYLLNQFLGAAETAQIEQGSRLPLAILIQSLLIML